MPYQNDTRFYDLGIYTHSSSLHGEVPYPPKMRISDLFNQCSTNVPSIKADFLEFINVFDPAVENDRYASYVCKDSIQIIAVSSADEGRGVGVILIK
jgi:hypothetical protein